MDTPELSIRELDALFEQSPLAMAFSDTELRTRRANEAFRRMFGLSDEALLGRRPTQAEGASVPDAEPVERTLAEQVIKEGVPVVNMSVELPLPAGRRMVSWTAYRVTDNDRVLGVVSTFIDITDSEQAALALRQANGRLDLLQRAGSEIGTTLDLRSTSEELAALAVPGLADRVAVDLLDPVLLDDPASTGPGTLRFRRFAVLDSTAEGPGNFAIGDYWTVPITQQPAVVFLRGEPVIARGTTEIQNFDLPAGLVRPLLARGVHTLLMVPLTARGITLGVAAFSRSKTPESYEDADVRLIIDLTARAAVHVDNARLFTREHNSAVTLQRSLLPRDTPQVAGLEIATRYLPASRAAEIGGDWFDVIPLAHGRVTLVVGDVTGHGIRAAAMMGQLRTTLAALAHLRCQPDEILRQLDAVVVSHGDEAGATCLHAFYDPSSRLCRLTSAGHPPPALRHPDGTTEFIDVPPGPLLGAGQGSYQTVDLELLPGCVLALYTDGLIEKPGEDLAVGMSRLTRALADGPTATMEELCASIIATLAPRPRDDVALLLARIGPTPEPALP
jgi:PAS domain S-box-containing protein